MKKKITALMFATLLLTSSCGSTKPAADKCCKEKTEVVDNNEILSNDPIMKTLAAVLIIVAVNILTTK